MEQIMAFLPALGGLGGIAKFLFSTLMALFIGKELGDTGLKLAGKGGLDEFFGFKPSEKEVEKATKATKEIQRTELLKELRQDQSDSLRGNRLAIEDDPFDTARDQSDFDILRQFMLSTGANLEQAGEATGGRGGRALRDLLSEKDRKEVDKVAVEASLPDLSQITREQVLGIAAPAAPPGVNNVE